MYTLDLLTNYVLFYDISTVFIHDNFLSDVLRVKIFGYACMCSDNYI